MNRGCALAMLGFLAITGCAPARPPDVSRETMPDVKEALLGSWEKVTTSPCSETYPDHLTFQPNGLYFGRRDPPGTFSIWDAGTFNAQNGRVTLSTANDALVSYELTIEGDRITFVDPERCTFQYRRVDRQDD